MEKKLDRKEIYKGKVISLNVDSIETAKGQKAIREFIEHPGGSCIALKDAAGKYFMVKQYRYAQGDYLLEFCAGKREPNEDPLETVKREVIEELGYSAKNIKYYGYIVPSCAILTEKIHLYSGEIDEKLKQHFDEDENIEVFKYSLEEVKDMIKKGVITDAKTIALTYHLTCE